MQRKRVNRRQRIPESLGNRLCGVWPYVFVLSLNAAVHGALLFSFGPSSSIIFHLLFSFLFFIHPLYYLTDVLWSLRPSVSGILSGEIAVNRKYYMNTVRKEVYREDLLPVTVSVPVYMENNEIIFETLKQSLAAIERYRSFSGQQSNIVVSDDGLALLLGGNCTSKKVQRVLQSLADGLPLTEQERKAAERIHFYRAHQIALVARPANRRAGLFKKASNLNFTLRLGKAVLSGASRRDLVRPGGPFEDGYWEGDITTHEIILLLDKDSGVHEGIMEAILPEFAADEKLAYVQCATNAGNREENYFTRAIGGHLNNLFHAVWPCKALQGFFVPLIGHNVFLRRNALEKSGLWAEDRVSEDYDKALCFYGMGYHGKYAQIRGLEFTEYVSRTFTEETGKQRRYAYGMFEMLFDGTLAPGKVRACDAFYMVLYFCSVINLVLLLPTVLLESYFGNVHLLWAGLLFGNLCFILPSLLRSGVMRRRLPAEQVMGVAHTLMIAASFVGHSFSFLAGAGRYLANKIKANSTPFPTTNVDQLEYRFKDGMRLLVRHVQKTPLFLVTAFLCVDRGIFLLTRKGLEPMTTLLYAYILFCAVLAPVLLTPQLFKRPAAPGTAEVRNLGLKKRLKHKRMSADWSNRDRDLTPLVTEREDRSKPVADIEQFLSGYRKTLQSSLLNEGMPEELLTEYAFESCIKKDADGRKALYLLRRKRDGAKALLRITQDYPEEDAMEEAKLLQRLDHPGIPKVYDSFERDGKRYLVREYVEGRTLFEIVSAKGCLAAKDVFGVARKLAEILRYLHTQTPPVIHRDIKPQNIVAGRDGSVHLIDFGIAREHKRQRRQDTSVVLTLDYASPEQYGFEQTTPLSDIYSLGVVLLFLSTGRTVRSDLGAQIVNNRLRELIDTCIAFNPKARFQSAEALLYFLRQDSTGQARKQKRGILVAAGVLAAAFGLSAISYGSGYALEYRRAKTRSYDRGYAIGYTEGHDAVPAFYRSNVDFDSSAGTDFENMSVQDGAFAAGEGGRIFFTAEGGIWAMSFSGTGEERLVQEESAQALSCYNGWVYYSSGDRIMQTNLYTAERNVLFDEIPGILYVTDNGFYLLAEKELFLLDTQTGNPIAVRVLSDCESLHTDGANLYYIRGADRGVYCCNFSGKEQRVLLNEPCHSLCLLGGYLYCATGADGNGRVLRMSAMTKDVETLLEADARMLNVVEGGLCYVDGLDGLLYRCSPDGRIQERISKNRVKDFNVIGSWIFYHNKEDGDRLWCVRFDGANDHPISAGR